MRHRLRLFPRWPVALSFLRRPVVPDVGMAVLLAALSVFTVWQLISPAADGSASKLAYEFGSLALLHWRLAGWLATTLGELAVLPLRHRFPVAVFGVTLAMAVAHSLLLPVTPSPADLAVAVAIFTIADKRPRLVSATTAGFGLLLAVGTDTVLAAGTSPGKSSATSQVLLWQSMIVPALVLAAAWIAGDSAKTRRAYVAEVERRAADAERDLGRKAELAAAAERERITRELHDVIAHALSVMVIQAQGAGSALRRRQIAETGAALDVIVATGRGALSETRRLLGVVRRAAGTEPELAPQPGLDDLPALAARVCGAGTPVQLRVTGAIRPLADGIELSAYRIIQEALTNTMKHGGSGAAAMVAVHYADSELVIEITDDGASGTGHALHASGAGGHGLAGMKARVAMLGGELAAGPRDGTGFSVRARLPVPGIYAELSSADTIATE
jgi:signal transduction histidine kinase